MVKQTDKGLFVGLWVEPKPIKPAEPLVIDKPSDLAKTKKPRKKNTED